MSDTRRWVGDKRVGGGAREGRAGQGGASREHRAHALGLGRCAWQIATTASHKRRRGRRVCERCLLRGQGRKGAWQVRERA